MGVINRIYRSFQHNDERYFRTRNFQLAAILFAQGFELVNIDLTNPRSVQFVFRNTFELQDNVERYLARRSLFVDAARLLAALHVLREKLDETSF